MSFSSEWLSLREPADHAARNRDVLAEVTGAFRGRDSLAIADLACGTGSNVRALAVALTVSRQQWTLVDHDAALLAAGREQLSAWADTACESDGGLTLTKGERTIDVRFREASLVAALDCVRDIPLDLVTAAALFDLTSTSWITGLVRELSDRRLPLYAALSYNGQEVWQPESPEWPEIHQAFLSHQRRDKGFGEAAGPDGWRVLTEALVRSGYGTVMHGPSPWTLGKSDTRLVVQLADGIAAAVVEQQVELVGKAAPWAASIRRAAEKGDASATIGHADVWSGLR